MDHKNTPETVAPPPVLSGCPRGCPDGECYCPDGSEPRACGHGPGGACNQGHCYDCDACSCGEDYGAVDHTAWDMYSAWYPTHYRNEDY